MAQCVIAYPQKSFIGGRFLQFVDVLDAEIPWQDPEADALMEMLQYSLRKLIAGIPLVLGVTLISFLLIVYFGPDQTYELLGKNPTPEAIAELRVQLGYDQPFRHALPGLPARDRDLRFRQLAVDRRKGQQHILARTIPVSLLLSIPGFVLGNLLGIGLALVAAYYRGGFVDKFIMGSAAVGMSSVS